jgi:hypothetical protein
MLPSADSLNQQLLNLPEETDRMQAATNFINVVGDFIDMVQAGPTGSPGIMTYTRPPAIQMIAALPEAKDQSWITNFAQAIHSGSTAAILVPGTVNFPAWTASSVDVLPPVNLGLGAALGVLMSGLQPVTSDNNPAMPLATAIYNYALAFKFLCTGLMLVPPGAPVPLPLPFTAE